MDRFFSVLQYRQQQFFFFFFFLSLARSGFRFSLEYLSLFHHSDYLIFVFAVVHILR